MQQRSEETRSRLLDASLKRFANDGFNAASVDAICNEAGVSKGAFYHHFPSKQAIFMALLNGWLQTIDSGLNAARGENIPQTFINMTATLPAIFAVANDRVTMFLEFWLQASRDEEIWDALINPYRHYREYFAQLIREGMQEGSFKPDTDPETAAQLVLSLAVGILLQGLLDPHGANWEKIANDSMQTIMRGLMK